MDFVAQIEPMWERLQREKRPIVIYGMGDGAEKILRVFAEYQIKVSAIFASDEFVRGHSFAGFQVLKLSQVVEKFGQDIVIVIAFASQRPEVLNKMYELDRCYDVFAPDVPVIGQGLFTPQYVQEHREKLNKVYDLLADEQSRNVFCSVVAYRLSGRIPYLRECETEKDEVFESILQPNTQEAFVDLGAYNGDTIRELLHYTDGKYQSITALEPDKKNFKKLKKYVDEALPEHVEIIQAGAWHEDATAFFAARAGRNSTISAQGIETQMRSVDSVLEGKPCTMIKFDVEGAEHNAILGAKKTITQYKPKLNLALYHRTEDIFDLPLLVHEICPQYKLYLRHHAYVPAWDTNLYAVSQG